MGEYNEKSEFEELGEEFGSIFQKSMDAMEQYSARMSKKQRERIESDYATQMENLEEIMDTMSEMFVDMEESLTDVDKMMYETLLKNRQKDLKRLERDYKRRNRQLDKDQKGFFEALEDGFNGISDSISSIAQVYTAIDVANIADSVEEVSMSVVEMRSKIKVHLGLAEDEFGKFSEGLVKSTQDLNKKYGNIFTTAQLTENAYALASELGVRGESFLLSMSEGLTKFEKVTGIEGTDSYQALFKIAGNWEESSDAIINSFNDLAVMGNRLGYSTGPQEYISVMNLMADTIARNAESAEDAQKRMANVAKTTAMLEDSWISAENWFGSLKEISSAAPEQLGDLAERYAWALNGTGLSIADIQKMLLGGDYSKVTQILLDGMADELASGNEYYINMVREAFGMESSEFDQLQVALREDPKYFAKLAEEIDNSYEASIKGSKEMEEALGDVHVGVIDRVKNAVTSSDIGASITNFIDELDLSLADMYAVVTLTGNVLKGAKGVITWIGGKLGLGSAAGGTGLLSKILGTAGSAGTAGTGLLGGLSKVGTSLGSSASTGTGLAWAGGLSIAGGALGAAGLVDAATDLWESTQAEKWQEREVKQKSAATKAGLVAAGAAIGTVVPGVGTLIGAGVGGLLALIGGDKVAQAFQDWSDGSYAIKNAMNDLTDAYSIAYETMTKTKAFEELEKLYSKQYKELKFLNPGSDEYNKKLDELKNTINQMNSILPNYVQVENDGVTIKESSLKATQQLLEAEKALARVRAGSAIDSVISSEGDLEEQWNKSKNQVTNNDDKIAAWNELNELYQNTKQYDDYIQYVDGHGLTYSMDAPQEAKDAYDLFQEKALSLYKEAGFDTAFDGVNWMNDKHYNKGLVWAYLHGDVATSNDFYNRVNKLISGDAEARADVLEKELAYKNAYLGAVETLETSLGGTFESIAQDYQNLSDNDKIYFKNVLRDLEDLNKNYNLMDPSEKVNVEDLRDIAGIDGSHKTGLWKVPFDNYRAVLHKDEAVLTKEDAEDWRSDIKRKKPRDYLLNLINGVADTITSATEVGITEAIKNFQSPGSAGIPSTGGISNKQAYIWKTLSDMGYNDYGVAGIMGNMMVESGLNPKNLQDTYESTLGHSDDSYTKGVDDGSYKNFVNDSAGYGLVQWTYHSLKRGLLDYAKSKGASIGDMSMQLSLLNKQLVEQYKGVDQVLRNATSVREASNKMLFDFENPLDKSLSAQNTRAGYGMSFFNKFSNMTAEELAQAVGLAQYAKGTNYVPETQLALVHEGERIIPASQNRVVDNSRSVDLATSIAASDNSSLIQVMRWGFEYLGKKLDNVKPVVVTQEEKKKKESKTESVFKLGGVLA